MITVKKINGKDMVVNCELIQMIDGGSDTVIHMTTGEKLISSDRPEAIVEKVIEYKKAIGNAGVHVYVHPEKAKETEEVEEFDDRAEELEPVGE